MVHMIQLEWIFLRRVTNNMGCSLTGVEEMLQESFLPRLFFVKSKYLTPIVGTLRAMPVSKSILGLLNSVMSENKKSKLAMCKHRVDSSRDQGRRVFQCRWPSGAQGRNTWRKKSRWRQRCQTQGDSRRAQWNWLPSYPMLQKHRCMA